MLFEKFDEMIKHYNDQTLIYLPNNAAMLFCDCKMLYIGNTISMKERGTALKYRKIRN